MTDELFDYFGKGSKKFEPLDDDLDLPEVSPKRRDDAPEAAAEPEPVKASAQPIDDIALPAETELTTDTDDDEDVFAGFGAGLFDASTDELPPRKQAAKVKPAAPEPKKVVAEKAKPEAKSKPAQPKPAKAKPAPEPVAEVAADDQSEDSEGGAWDFIAGVLGIGGKKNKADEDTTDDAKIDSDETAAPVAKDKQRAAGSNKDQPKADVKSFFQEPKPASEAAVDALFNTADDGLDLAGWGDDDEDEVVAEAPVAEKPAKAERPARAGRERKPKPAKEDREDRSRSPKAKAPVVDDLIDDIDEDDENFIEFEVEELTPSARDKKEAPSDDRPRRRRRPVRENSDEDSVSENAPRSRSRNDRDDTSSESRSGGRGRSRGRGRGRNQNDDRDTRSSKPVAKVDRDSGGDDWRDDKPEADSEQRSERSRGSRGRGRGRKRPEPQERESKPFEESLDDDLEISGFVDDDGDDLEAEEAPKKSRRSRRPRSRSRGRSRNDNDRDDSDQDSSTDLDVDGLDSSEHDSSDRETSGRGSGGRSRRGRNSRGDRDRNDRDRDSESSPRRGRGSRGSRDRDDSPDEKPVYAEVPTWDETIESMIESNIKNHESGAGRGRGGGGRSRGGNNRNSNSRNRR